jgi:AraC-like DNA-binding protein
MKRDVFAKGFRKSLSVRPGMSLHIADFLMNETRETRFESTSPLLRFYFYIAAAGFWDLRAPCRSASEWRVAQCDRVSMVFFYPELEGKMHMPAEKRQFHLSIHVLPSVLNGFLGGSFEEGPTDLRDILEGCDTKGFAHGRALSQPMIACVQQIIDSPYSGAMQRLYIESKAIELIAHKLAQIQSPDASPDTPRPLRAGDVDRLRFAKEILSRDLESPPTLLELARTLGTNHSALNRGFRDVYGTTVFGYLRKLRLMEAKRLLEEEGKNVTEAALTVGYNSLPSFSRAFLSFFGQTPSKFQKRQE